MVKVYVYKDNSEIYRVQPGVAIITGGHTFRVVNASPATVTVTIPDGASERRGRVTKSIPRNERADFITKSQGAKKARAYNYDVVTRSGKAARGNSDPILIIEN